MNVIFRIDSSEKIGNGHVERCLHLAKYFSKKKIRIIIIYRKMFEIQLNEFKKISSNIYKISHKSKDLSETIRFIKSHKKPDILIIDNYEIDYKWELIVKKYVKKLFVIDDFENKKHHCDFYLNQNFLKFDNLKINQDCIPMLGTSYSIIKDGIKKQRKLTKNKYHSLDNIFICFGGIDYQNYTFTTLKALIPFLPHFKEINVICSINNPNISQLKIIINKYKEIKLHISPEDFSNILSKSDFAIGACGVLNNERMFLGIPSLIFGISENQNKIAENLIDGGYVLGNPKFYKPEIKVIQSWIDLIINNKFLLSNLSKKSKTLIDGEGIRRIYDVINLQNYEFKPVTLEDCEILFDWRNHKINRNASFSSIELVYNDHKKWLMKKLRDKNCIFRMVKRGKKNCGTVRFDCINEIAIISIYKNPSVKFAPNLIISSVNWLSSNYKQINEVQADILSSNIRSIKAFKKAGFAIYNGTYKKEIR